MSKIFYFNPETDLILATDGFSFTPSKKIKEMRRCLALLPSILAEEDDYILMDNPWDVVALPYFQIAKQKNIRIIGFEDLDSLSYKDFSDGFQGGKDCSVTPWGWNRLLINALKKYGVPSSALPNDEWMMKFRQLSHRNITIKFFDSCKVGSPLPSPQFHSVTEEALNAIAKFGKACIKAPWSSSGRGVMFTHQLEDNIINNRINSIISKQGGVLIEKYLEKRLDCATEWIVTSEGETFFVGHSIFETDSHGHYLYNIIDTEENLAGYVRSFLSDKCFDYLSLQRDFIIKFINPNYYGPLGIDMLIDKDGNLNPCLEINLRTTMGHIAIQIQKQIEDHYEDNRSNSSFFNTIKSKKLWRPI